MQQSREQVTERTEVRPFDIASRVNSDRLGEPPEPGAIIDSIEQALVAAYYHLPVMVRIDGETHNLNISGISVTKFGGEDVLEINIYVGCSDRALEWFARLLASDQRMTVRVPVANSNSPRSFTENPQSAEATQASV